jgi:hypothetical protein
MVVFKDGIAITMVPILEALSPRLDHDKLMQCTAFTSTQPPYFVEEEFMPQYLEVVHHHSPWRPALLQAKAVL